MKTMHLFAGGGGGMYADLILGHTPTVAVEWDAYACKVLRERKADGWWPDCEIIEGDITSFSGKRYAGEVDCIHAGFPCQDLSIIRRNRAGLDGNKSILYREAIRIFCEVRPRYLFLENVTGIFTANDGEALNRVLSDLAQIGFDSIRWTCLSASDVGASHRRERWWCFAELSADPTHEPIQKQDMVQPAKVRDQGKPRRIASDVSRDIRTFKWEEYQSPMDRGTYVVPNWIDRSKAIGNGQVPLQAAMAWVRLGGPHNLDLP